MFILECNCGSTDFNYEESKFICNDCGKIMTETQAGKNLIEVEED